MPYIVEGEPRVFISEQGAEIEFKGGQPVMDKGLENAAIISLFTKSGWAGNAVITDPNAKVGGRYEEIAQTEAITLSMLNRLSRAAESDLSWMIKENLARSIVAVTTNPTGRQLETKITITPPGDTSTVLLITKNGPNWIAQKLDPAYRRE